MPIVTGLQANVFRAVSGSLFSSAVNWSRGIVPTGSDVAVIADNCTIDVSRTLGSLIVRAPFTASINTGLTLRINDTINILGHLSCSGNPNIISVARKNIINSLSPGTSTFLYSGSNPQSVAGGPYYNLTILGNAIRKTNTNLITSGAILINQFANLDLGPYDLDAFGTIYMGAVGDGDGTLTKSQPGSIKIGGLLSVDTHASNVKGLDFSGNPTIELKGGISVFNQSQQAYTGMGLLKFTTNNQNITPIYGAINFYNPILISGSIAVTASGIFSAGVYINNTLTGTDPSSLLYNTSNLYFNYQPSYDITSGSLNITSSAGNVVGYVFNGNATLPYTLYRNLRIYGTGTKTLKGNTIVSESLYVYSGYGDSTNNTILELSSSNLVVSGTAYIGTTGNRGTLSRIYNGSTTFLGPVNVDVSNTIGPAIDFSASNADIEFRNGFGIYDPNSRIRTGTGSWYFTTNNQSLVSSNVITLDTKIIISGAIALTSSFAGLALTNIINGTEANSKFVNRGGLYFATSQSLNGSLTTGSYDFSYIGNTVGLVGNYNGTTPARFNTFYNLYTSGTGIKTLGTSSYVSGNLSFGNPAILELSSSNLFVNGTTFLYNGNILTRSGSGTTVFNGSANLGDFGRIDFRSSNSSIEFRNGFGASYEGYCYLGSGSAIFSTNNQTYAGGIVTSGPTIISGSIRLKNTAGLSLYNTINGTDPLSILDNSGSVSYFTASAVDFSMTTGSFISASYPGSALNFYFSGSYKIPMSSFRNLGLNPGGIVTSPGYKTFNRDVIIHEGLTITRDSIDTENNNLTILGTTYFQYAGAIKKSGSGSILLSGSLRMGDFGTIDFTSANNASLEMRGGLILASYGTAVLMGTSSLTCSVNSQNIISCNFSNNYHNVLISGPITVGFGGGSFIISGSLNGTDTNSKMYLSASSTINYLSPQQPMQIGILDVSSSLNTTFVYISGSQDIKGGTYRNLTMLSGTKTLQGNVSVLGTLSTGSGATLATINLNGFTLTNP